MTTIPLLQILQVQRYRHRMIEPNEFQQISQISRGSGDLVEHLSDFANPLCLALLVDGCRNRSFTTVSVCPSPVVTFFRTTSMLATDAAISSVHSVIGFRLPLASMKRRGSLNPIRRFSSMTRVAETLFASSRCFSAAPTIFEISGLLKRAYACRSAVFGLQPVRTAAAAPFKSLRYSETR
jgi:hypothetical protein